MRHSIRTFLLLLALFMGVCSETWAQEPTLTANSIVIDDGIEHGTVAVKELVDRMVTITVTPEAGYSIQNSDIVVQKLVDPAAVRAPRRAITIADLLAVSGPAKSKIAAEYTFEVPADYAGALVTVTFRQLATAAVTVPPNPLVYTGLAQELVTIGTVEGKTFDNGTKLDEDAPLDGYYTKSGDVYTPCNANDKADGTTIYYKPLVTYSTTENGIYSSTIPIGTNAGTYTVYYKYTADEDHADGSGRVMVVINKAPITSVELNEYVKKHTGSAITFSIKSVKAGELSVLETDYDVNSNDLSKTDIGTYTCTVTAKSTSTNFTGSASVNFRIVEESTVFINSSSSPSDMAGKYVLTEDISASVLAGLYSTTVDFTGELDGNFHKITGLSGHALFNTISGDGKVKNVILEDVNITTGDPTNGDAGAICNIAKGATRIYNCGIQSTDVVYDDDGNVETINKTSGSKVSGTRYVGGLVGLLDGSARVINCYSYASITGGTHKAGIVGYNNYASKYGETNNVSNIRTMVMNCMFYGDISLGGTELAPIYGGEEISNEGSSRLNNYNYFVYEAPFSINNSTTNPIITKYNRALAAEERYLVRFEFYRNLVNSTRELASWYVFGSVQTDAHEKIAKWVLDPSIAPYPILKPQGYYPSVVNYDPDNTYDKDRNRISRYAISERAQGKQLGTLSVTINLGSGYPTGASITKGSLTLNRIDKDTLNYNFNYDKVQLPYYNDVGTGNYTKNKVVTGWKITSMVGGTQGSFSTSYDAPGYNFADRTTYAKDLYSESKRVFSQGAYFDVPDGVTSITIEPYWGFAAYLSDEGYDAYYTSSNDSWKRYNVNSTASIFGQRYTNATSTFNGDQLVYTSFPNALARLDALGRTTSTSVYDYAVVLVGNYHHKGMPEENGQGNTTKKHFTVMSVDFNYDNEPDYSLIIHSGKQEQMSPIRFDFINVPGAAMAHKITSYTYMGILGNMKFNGWFETTNTTTIHFSQFEYDSEYKSLAPLILMGGVVDMFTSTNGSEGATTHTTYIHVGGNVYFKLFNNGCHMDKKKTSTPHRPISVTGGDYKKFYLSGYLQQDAPAYTTTDGGQNAECYISGGRFGEVAGAGYEKIDGNVTWQIFNADMQSFYGGGINENKAITGSISTTIRDSHVGTFCGGPKFGNMSTDKTVTTNATGCTFDKFFGAGFGGTAITRVNAYNKFGSLNYTWNGTTENFEITPQFSDSGKTHSRGKYNSGKGISISYDYENFEGSSVNTVGYLFVNYASLSVAQTNSVISTLTGCTINKDFYGGGSLGAVTGDVTSTLTNCTVLGSAYGAGFSAAVPTASVFPAEGFKTPVPFYNSTTGVFEPGGGYPDAVLYTWSNDEGSTTNTLVDTEDGKHYIHVDKSTVDLSSLGTVTGKVTLNIAGTTTVAGSVYGGGEESAVDGDTEVNVTSGTIGTAGQGGAKYGNVYGGGMGKDDDVLAGLVKGNTKVTISQAEGKTTTVYHNVYGGGAYGSVGTFSYDATTGLPTGWTTTDNKGKCTVSITGGTIGSTGKENGMVFGSSRGLEGNPETNANVDKMAWVYDTDVTIGTPGSETGPSIKGSVYGGGENGHNFHDASVTVHSGIIGVPEGGNITDDGGTPDDESDDITYSGARYPNRGNVYGSGCGTDTYTGTDSKTYFDFNAGIVRGNTTVLIDGGHVVHNVYGGGAMGSVGTYTFDANGKPISCAEETGTCTVTVSGGQIGVTGAEMAGYGKGGPDDFGHVFGAGRGEMHDPDQYPNIETCAFFNKAILNISGTAFLTGSAYGGSESGHVLGDTEVNISGGQIGCGKNATEPYGNDVWADDYTPTASVNLDCASWPFESPFAPYDPFANATGDLDKYPNGESTDGGRLEASDGHTYYGNVFGGGSGSIPYFDETEGISKYMSTAGSVEGMTTINITGGHIITNVYGGCEATNVKGSATITMTGGTVGVPRTVAQIVAHPNTGYIFGAGKGDQRIFFNKETNVDRTEVNIEGGRVYGSIFGGGEDGHVFQNAIVNIGKTGEDGPTIGTWGTSYVDGNVFGGGRGFGGDALTAGNIGGSVELNIKSGKILGSVYGGGRLASVGYGLYLVDETITEGGQTIKPYGILRPNDKYDGSYPDPSTGPASTYFDKGRGYITINISGGTIGNDNEYIYNPTAEQKAAIPNTTFDYQNHLQYTKGGNVFTGGMGRLYALDNTTLLPIWSKLGKCKGTTLNMTGGTVKSSIYGGGEIGAVAQDATVNINGGTVGTKVVDSEDATKYYYFGSVFGGGKGSVDNITYPSTTPEAEQIPISEAGTTGGDVLVKLNEVPASSDDAKGAIVHQVFGCNDMNGSPKGDVTVHVYATQNADKVNISTKYAKDTEKFDVEAVYGGGNLAAYEPEGGKNTTKSTNVIIDGCGLTSIRQVYGGGNAASTPATDVEINGTYEIAEVFGGGNGLDALPNGRPNPGANVGYKNYTIYEQDGDVLKAKDDPDYDTKEERTAEGSSIVYGTGAANVNIKGGTIHRVFGGSNTKGNVRITAVTMLEEAGGCPFCVDEAYGGGKSAPMDAEAKLLMACIPGLKEAYGGAQNAEIDGDVTLTITNGTFERIFGGNDEKGYIKGTITVNIEETGCKPIIIGELYGGGNQAPYTAPEGKHGPTLNVRSFTSIGDIYGGGLGSTATVTGDTYVNINVSEGRWRDGTYQYATDPSVGVNDKITELNGKGYHAPAFTSGMGSIHTVFGGGNAAPVTGNTHVNVATSEYDEIVSVAAGSDVTGYYTRSGEGTEASPYTYTEATGTAGEGTTYYKKVKGADIRGNIYGGGNAAEVTGNTNVVIGKKKE